MNLRSSAPEADALPGYATPRLVPRSEVESDPPRLQRGARHHESFRGSRADWDPPLHVFVYSVVRELRRSDRRCGLLRSRTESGGVRVRCAAVNTCSPYVVRAGRLELPQADLKDRCPVLSGATRVRMRRAFSLLLVVHHVPRLGIEPSCRSEPFTAVLAPSARTRRKRKRATPFGAALGASRFLVPVTPSAAPSFRSRAWRRTCSGPCWARSSGPGRPARTRPRRPGGPSAKSRRRPTSSRR